MKAVIEVNKIYNESCLETLARMPDCFIDNCITSPPYFGLRDYGTATWEGGDEGCKHTVSGWNDTLKPNVDRPERDGSKRQNCLNCGASRIDAQIGLEETPELYVAKLVEVFTEVKRVIKNDGTLWLNLGDSYWGGKGQSGSRGSEFQEQRNLNGESINKGYQTLGGAKETRPTDKKHEIIKPKDLIGIPWLVAFALRNSGWYLRQDIVWNKPNPMPESVTDRCTKAHEYIFLLSKSSKYHYNADAIKEDAKPESAKRYENDFWTNGKHQTGGYSVNGAKHTAGMKDFNGKANKRSVWTVTTQPYKEAHFAVFPEELIEPCVLTTKKDAIIYDPFGGSGTTGVVAMRAGRRFILSELSEAYCRIAEKRLRPYLQQINLF